MPVFSQEELNLIYLYNPGNLKGLLYELRSMQCVLMPDEKELRNLTEGTIRKVEKLTRDGFRYRMRSICFLVIRITQMSAKNSAVPICGNILLYRNT